MNFKNKPNYTFGSIKCKDIQLELSLPELHKELKNIISISPYTNTYNSPLYQHHLRQCEQALELLTRLERKNE